MRVYYYFDPGLNNKNNFDVLENILGNRRIKISKISSLNDPFDSQVSFSTNVPAAYKKGFTDKYREIDDEIGIISFSTDIRNILMWSHYAKKHEGAALGIELDESLLSRVRYSCFPPEIGYGDNSPQEHVRAVRSALMTKATDWFYEHEWRMVIPYRNNPTVKTELDNAGVPVRFLMLDTDSIKAVYMGFKCKMEQRDMLMLLHKCKLDHVNVYKMDRSQTEYALVCKPFGSWNTRQYQIKACITNRKNKKGI